MFSSKLKTLEIKEGDQAHLNRTFTKEDLEQFSALSGDYNPIHLSEDYAKALKFDGLVVHGALTNRYV